ncbi:hypothetical protein GGI43DRAFT_426707 [Trichoderma evansii]
MGWEALVIVSGLSVHKQGSLVGVEIESVSFKLNGDDAQDLECSAKNVAFPVPDDILRCEFSVMVYYDVGDSHADRGGSDVPTVCDNSHGTGPADDICTQDQPVTFKIDEPVGIGPDL